MKKELLRVTWLSTAATGSCAKRGGSQPPDPTDGVYRPCSPGSGRACRIFYQKKAFIKNAGN